MMSETAKVVNTSPVVVLDGGGRVTLSGADQRQILYLNTSDPAQIWTTSHCQNQEQPQLTIQHLHFTGGSSTGQLDEGGGGGAVFVRGGRVKVIDMTFTSNRCDAIGPDLGGGALRVLSQSHGLAVVVATSTFAGNVCSNGAALSSIGVSWPIFNSVFTANSAIGTGANPARPGTPGGGSGGAIYLDGVSNDRTGELRISRSVLQHNISRGFDTAGLPGIFFLGLEAPQVTDSTIA